MIKKTKGRIALDVECYTNYFSIGMKSLDTGSTKVFRVSADNQLDKQSLAKILRSYTIITFNGNGYDIPMVSAALAGWGNARLKQLSDKLVTSKDPAWMVCSNIGLDMVKCDHIDIINVAKGMVSLKIYGGRLHFPKLQDLPYHHDTALTMEQIIEVDKYNINDLDTTIALYESLKKQINLRIEMSEEFGIDLRSKSDAQIAEAVIRNEFKKAGVDNLKPPSLPRGYTFKYQTPVIIEFKDPTISRVFDRLLAEEFKLSEAGKPEMPLWLKKTKIQIGGRKYSMGIGGLHSNEKKQYVTRETDDDVIADFDVASYYPSIILQQGVYPKQLGRRFLEIFDWLVTRRLAAKAAGDTVLAEILKIVINGIYGKLGSKWSIMYSPDLLLQTTFTGQLALLMLIETLEDNGINVISANTDGIVTKYKKHQEELVGRIIWDWMLQTSYQLERNDYRTVASLDVNGYLAIKMDGSVKGKKNFACIETDDKTGKIVPRLALDKNPDRTIVYRAVAEFLVNGTPIEDTVRGCDDIRQFVAIRQVTGGAVWRDEELGKAVRMYYSNEVDIEEALRYVKDGRKVANSGGCRPALNLPAELPADINYDRYIAEAYETLTKVGYENA